MQRLALVLALAAGSLHADPGTWNQTLAARDLQGRAVALDSSAAVFLYDATLNVTWLRQASQPSGLSWAAANRFAANFQLGGFDDWRLPRVLDLGASGCTLYRYAGTDCGHNVALQNASGFNEVAHLFHVTLGNQAAYTPEGVFRGGANKGVTWGLVEDGPFMDLRATTYWSGTGIASAPGYAFSFDLDQGFQSPLEKSRPYQLLLLRDGDVLSAVPEPSTALLFGAGALLLLRRRRFQA
jgi:Protein of unknown function (DUF1566)/PEP-CTERM motif